MDLPELFDFISYDVQKEKLSIIGSNSDAQNLLIFFPNRLQRVKLDSIHSNWMKVIRGVTKEKVLGSLLFNLYVNDLCTANDTDVTMIQYADHCLILASNKDKKIAKKSMESIIHNLAIYFRGYHLYFNSSQTKFIYFSKRTDQ